MATETNFRFYETPNVQTIPEVIGILCHEGARPSVIKYDELDGENLKYVEAYDIDETYANRIAKHYDIHLEVVVSSTA